MLKFGFIRIESVSKSSFYSSVIKIKSVNHVIYDMKSLKALVFFIIPLAMTSCSKKSGTAVTATTIEVAVSEGNNKDVSVGTTVELYESVAAVAANTPKYTQTTNVSGKAVFTVVYLSKYYVVAHKGTERNFYAGYIPIGTFTSDTEISYSPAQTPPGVVGGVKFQDTNHDGVINSSDVVAAPSVEVIANSNTFFNVAIY